MPPVEDCTNGVDDDTNGQTDCADAACTATHTCTTTPPAGWNGPVVLYDGDPANVPDCPADHPTKDFEGHAELLTEPAMCDACVCAAPPINCTLMPLALTSDAACAMQTGTVVQPAPMQCLPVTPTGSPSGAKADAPVAAPAACAPSGGTKTLPPPKWGRAGLACGGGGLGLGCGAGKECTGKAAAPFEPGLCVWSNGNVPCPSSYPMKHGFTGSVVDTRGCTACSCGGPTASCTATTKVYSNAACNGAGLDVPNDGSCTTLNGNPSAVEVVVTKTGSCPPSGGQAVGTIVEGALGTTVCCAP